MFERDFTSFKRFLENLGNSMSFESRVCMIMANVQIDGICENYGACEKCEKENSCEIKTKNGMILSFCIGEKSYGGYSLGGFEKTLTLMDFTEILQTVDDFGYKIVFDLQKRWFK